MALVIWSLRSRVAPLEKYSMRTRKNLLLSCSFCHAGLPQRIAKNASSNTIEMWQIDNKHLPPNHEQRDEKAGIGGMTNEPVGTRFDHGLLGGDGHRRREGGAEHVDGVETQRDPRVDEQNAQPEEKCASARDGGGRNLKRQQRAEED